MNLISIVLSGGAGSRFWPVSRELQLRPFIRLANKQSLLQKAFMPEAQLSGVKEISTITNREFHFKISAIPSCHEGSLN